MRWTAGESADSRRWRTRVSTRAAAIVPPRRVRYLAEVAETVRGWRARVEAQVGARPRTPAAPGGGADAGSGLRRRGRMPRTGPRRRPSSPSPPSVKRPSSPRRAPSSTGWPALREAYSGDEHESGAGERTIRTALTHTTLSGNRIPKISLPRYRDAGDLLGWLMRENVPGRFPFTAGVFPFKREGEDPLRMFAGEGDAARTNERFHYLSQHSEAKRLSTAFDSVTLYGFDPDHRPDIYGKVGNSGVSIATLDDMKVLYGGFDLCDPATSVSMTINGPAPTILAMFLNTAIDQQAAAFEAERGRAPDAEEAAALRASTLERVRGTVQADILKEDQGQNTCIFSTEFSLKVMGDIQAYFTRNRVRNFYSVSISGYHIAEAGANPISQLAFTLANGFTYVEAYLARGMDIDDFAPNFSFFFSNGLCPEYSVLGRVARRIWAVAMREKYGANEPEPEAQVPHPDLRPLPPRAGDRVQRHPHHPPGPHRDLRPLQQPAHERLRRGDHHPHRGQRAAGGRNPARHQPGVGARGRPRTRTRARSSSRS